MMRTLSGTRAGVSSTTSSLGVLEGGGEGVREGIGVDLLFMLEWGRARLGDAKGGRAVEDEKVDVLFFLRDNPFIIGNLLLGSCVGRKMAFITGERPRW